jgi:hypothetical protein
MIPEDLLEAVIVDPSSPSGLVWASSGGPRRRAGNKVGSKSDRYWNTRWQGKTYKVHRVIMVKLYGQSELDVDHIDRDVFNNHPDNLRWVDHSGNMKNRVFKPKANGLPQGIHRNTTGGYRFHTGKGWSKTYKTLKEAIDGSTNLDPAQLPLVRQS